MGPFSGRVQGAGDGRARYLELMTRLPLNLQMIASLRTAGSSRPIIKAANIELALRHLVQEIPLPFDDLNQ